MLKDKIIFLIEKLVKVLMNFKENNFEKIVYFKEIVRVMILDYVRIYQLALKILKN